MLRKALRFLSVGALLCALPFAPHGALAQFAPPPGPPPAPPVGGPPGPGLGAPPLRGPVALPPHVGAGGAGLAAARGVRGVDRGALAGARGIEARAVAGGYGRAAARYGYGYGRGWRQWARYGAYAAASTSYAYSDDDGCYYVTAYRRHAYRRVLVCR